MTNYLPTADQVVLTGIGKSGDAARLAASLLQSVRVRAQFIHATDLLHGGLGVLRDSDTNCLIALSHSGTTIEIQDVFDNLSRSVTSVLVTGRRLPNDLYNEVGLILNYHIDRDGSEHGTIPVYSAMEQIKMMGEIASDIADQLSAEELLRFHPQGNLKRAYTKETLRD